MAVGDIEITRVLQEHRKGPNVTVDTEPVSLAELDEIRNTTGEGLPVQNTKAVNIRQAAPSDKFFDANGEEIQRFNYKKDDDVPALGLPQTFGNADKPPKFVTATDGNSVPTLGLPNASGIKKSPTEQHNADADADYEKQSEPVSGDVPKLGLPQTYPEEK